RDKIALRQAGQEDRGEPARADGYTVKLTSQNPNARSQRVEVQVFQHGEAVTPKVGLGKISRERKERLLEAWDGLPAGEQAQVIERCLQAGLAKADADDTPMAIKAFK